MIYNRITAEIGESRRITTRPISYQYDTVQILMLTAAEGVELPEYYQVDFCVIGDEDTVTMVGSLSGGAPIPDSLLRQGENLVAYLVLTGAEGDVQTRYEITIPVNERPTRSGIELSDDQQAQVDSLVEALNEGVDRAEAAAEAIQDMGVEAETLAAGSEATVEKEVDPETGAVTLTFGIPRGNQGDPGTTPDFRIGTVETLPPTSPATATITGTAEEPVLNLGIPQGQKGDPGGSGGTTDYRELENKPQINGHTLSGDQSASDLGLGTYSKPGTGIPKTDLASDVQQSLGKADSALQSAPVSSVAGKTGAVQLNAGDIEFADSETYAAGSIGAEVSQQKNAISELDSNIGKLNGNLVELLQAILSAGVYSEDQSTNIANLANFVVSKDVASISAVYTGGAVEANTSVDDLRPDLTVTANYTDGTTETVTAYTLSGTIEVGTNIITVTYEGKTTTFTVVGVLAPIEITDSMDWESGKRLNANGGVYDDAAYSVSKVVDVSEYTSLRITTTSSTWFAMSVFYEGIDVDGSTHGQTVQFSGGFWGGQYMTDETVDISDYQVLRFSGQSNNGQATSQTRYFVS